MSAKTPELYYWEEYQGVKVLRKYKPHVEITLPEREANPQRELIGVTWLEPDGTLSYYTKELDGTWVKDPDTDEANEWSTRYTQIMNKLAESMRKFNESDPQF